jgi:hypothetical protein
LHCVASVTCLSGRSVDDWLDVWMLGVWKSTSKREKMGRECQAGPLAFRRSCQRSFFLAYSPRNWDSTAMVASGCTRSSWSLLQREVRCVRNIHLCGWDLDAEVDSSPPATPDLMNRGSCTLEAPLSDWDELLDRQQEGVILSSINLVPGQRLNRS